MARLLRDTRTDKNKALTRGTTALVLAPEQGHLEVVRLLCDARADKDKALMKAKIDHAVATYESMKQGSAATPAAAPTALAPVCPLYTSPSPRDS